MRLKKLSLSFGTQIFRALSEESRVRILYLLYYEKELCISDMEHILDFTQTKTSRHLTYLKNASLVNSRKKDKWVFYFIKDEAYDFISQIFKYLNTDPVLVKDLETYRILFSNRELAANKLDKKWLE